MQGTNSSHYSYTRSHFPGVLSSHFPLVMEFQHTQPHCLLITIHHPAQTLVSPLRTPGWDLRVLLSFTLPLSDTMSFSGRSLCWQNRFHRQYVELPGYVSGHDPVGMRNWSEHLVFAEGVRMPDQIRRLTSAQQTTGICYVTHSVVLSLELRQVYCLVSRVLHLYHKLAWRPFWHSEKVSAVIPCQNCYEIRNKYGVTLRHFMRQFLPFRVLPLPTRC